MRSPPTLSVFDIKFYTLSSLMLLLCSFDHLGFKMSFIVLFSLIVKQFLHLLIYKSFTYYSLHVNLQI